MAEEKTGDDNELMSEFAEFLETKRANEAKQKEEEDFDVEIWDEKGRGVRTKRSHAKPFLQSLGIDLDPPKDDGKTDDGDQGKGSTKTPRKTSPKGAESTVRKYFTSGAAKK